MTFRDRWNRFKERAFRNPFDYDVGWCIATILGFGLMFAIPLTYMYGIKAFSPALFVPSMGFMGSCILWHEREDQIRRVFGRIKRFFNINIFDMKWYNYWLTYVVTILMYAGWYHTLGLSLDALSGNSPWFLLAPAMMTLYTILGGLAFDKYRERITGWFDSKFHRYVKRKLSCIDYVNAQADEDTESYLDRLGVYDAMPVSTVNAKKKARQLVNSRGSERERLMQEMLEDMERMRRSPGWTTEDDDHH